MLRFGAVAPWLLLSFLLFLIGLVLVLLGFDLNDVDRWIEARGGLFDAIGTFLFRAGCGVVLLICVATIGGALFDRNNSDRPGAGCSILALVAGYFAWFGVTGG